MSLATPPGPFRELRASECLHRENKRLHVGDIDEAIGAGNRLARNQMRESENQSSNENSHGVPFGCVMYDPGSELNGGITMRHHAVLWKYCRIKLDWRKVSFTDLD